MPSLDTAVVPPWYSCGVSFLARARAANPFLSLEMVRATCYPHMRMIG